MGREVRRVPPGWMHPKKNGRYIPLLDGWSREVEEREQWARGFKRDYRTKQFVPHDEHDKGYSVADYFGERFERDDYMPEWPTGVATYLMMYETTSEGTPISPAFESPEQLASWLADTNASAFADMGASYESWLKTILADLAGQPVFTGAIMVAGGPMTPAIEPSQRLSEGQTTKGLNK